MFRRILLGSTFLLVLISSRAFSQAAAESALANSASGAAAAKSGSALGNALNKALDTTGNQLANGVQNLQPNPTSPAPLSNRAPLDSAASNSKPPVPHDSAQVQFSVQGAGTVCPPAKDWTQDEADPSADTTITVCAAHAKAKPFPKTRYKPVVEVTF
jgi:hypothetical protein